MPPRKRITNITRLLPRKRASTPDPAPASLPPLPQRDCHSMPAGLGSGLDDDLTDAVDESATLPPPIAPAARDLRAHRFAHRYESDLLHRYHATLEEDRAPHAPPRYAPASPAHSSERPDLHERSVPHCELAALRAELSLLREGHTRLSETTRETLRLAEALEARVESLHRRARPSERLFWMLLDGLASVVLFLVAAIVRPWVVVRKWFVAERVRKRRSWRLSVGDFENDPFLGDVAKRLSFSAVED